MVGSNSLPYGIAYSNQDYFHLLAIHCMITMVLCTSLVGHWYFISVRMKRNVYVLSTIVSNAIWNASRDKTFQLEHFVSDGLPYGNAYNSNVRVLSLHHRLSNQQATLYKQS